MTLSDPESVADDVAARAADTKASQFLVVYASIVGGKSWCPDCVAAEPLLNSKFSDKEASRLTIQYAGDKETWRAPGNSWKKWGVPALPTLYKVTPDGTWSKLVEADVYDEKKLSEFVAAK